MLCVKRIVFLRGWVLNDIIYELMQVLRLTAGERLMRDYYSDEVKGLPPPVSCGQSSLQIVAYLKRLTRAFAVELDEAGFLDTLGDGDGVIVESGLDSQEDTAGIMQKQRNENNNNDNSKQYEQNTQKTIQKTMHRTQTQTNHKKKNNKKHKNTHYTYNKQLKGPASMLKLHTK